MKKDSDPEHGAFISRKGEAQAKVRRFREKFPNNKVEGLLISARLLRQLLDHGDCRNVMVHFGAEADGELTLIFAPVGTNGERIGIVLDAEGNLRHPEAGLKDADDDKVLNRGTQIPPPYNVY
jgi:hypothetical protein